MDVTIKKIGERDGAERFILVNARTRQVLTANDVSEKAIRRFFEQLGASDDLIDDCLERARERYLSRDDGADEPPDAEAEDDLLFELGLDEDETH